MLLNHCSMGDAEGRWRPSASSSLSRVAKADARLSSTLGGEIANRLW